MRLAVTSRAKYLQNNSLIFSRDEVEQLSRECRMRVYWTSVKEDINVGNVFQHLAENYVNQVTVFKVSLSLCGSLTNLSGLLKGSELNGCHSNLYTPAILRAN